MSFYVPHGRCPADLYLVTVLFQSTDLTPPTPRYRPRHTLGGSGELGIIREAPITSAGALGECCFCGEHYRQLNLHGYIAAFPQNPPISLNFRYRGRGTPGMDLLKLEAGRSRCSAQPSPLSWARAGGNTDALVYHFRITQPQRSRKGVSYSSHSGSWRGYRGLRRQGTAQHI